MSNRPSRIELLSAICSILFLGLLGFKCCGGVVKDDVSHTWTALRWARHFYYEEEGANWNKQLPLMLYASYSFEHLEEGDFEYPNIDMFDSSWLCENCQSAYVYTLKASYNVKGRPLKLWRPTDDVLVVYSFGPDKKLTLPISGEGVFSHIHSFEYDPTNGTYSDGDIFIAIRKSEVLPSLKTE